MDSPAGSTSSVTTGLTIESRTPLSAYLGGASPVLHLRDSRSVVGRRRRARLGQCRWGGCVEWVPAGCRFRPCSTPGRGALLARTSGHAPVELNDARAACRDWFDSLAGAGKGRKVGHPRFRSRKDNRAPIRLTRNALGAAAGGVRVARVGDVRLAQARALPSVPSGVTVIREAGGRHCASFVVAVAAPPLPARA